MTFKNHSRAGLLALILVFFLGIVLGVSNFSHTTYAQDTPTEQSTGPEPPVPSCDAKMQINCSPNSGDTAWMMTSVALVLMMTIPGLGLFYGGMVRRKN